MKISPLAFFLYFITSNYTFSQKIPTKIEIVKNIYLGSFIDGNEKLYKSDKKIIKKSEEIKKIYSELSNINNEPILSQFGIDTIAIKKNPIQLISLYENKNEIVFNQQQIDFISKELSEISNYKQNLEEYLDNGCCYSMHNSYRNEYIISLYESNKIIDKYIFRKFVHGFKFPWINSYKNRNYNFKLDKLIDVFFDDNSRIKAPLKNVELLKYLVNKIIDGNIRKLYELSAYSYINDINDLR